MSTYDLYSSIPSPSSLVVGDILNASNGAHYSEGNNGSIVTITLPPGTFKFQCWGGRGGSNQSDNYGMGGYSVGLYTITANTTLYLVPGGNGYAQTLALPAGGYNGGGKGGYGIGGSGGGATHIATASGLLSTLSSKKSSIIMVAGGGGGGGYYKASYVGGSGGGTTGGDSVGYNTTVAAKGATQSAGGAAGGGSYVKGDAGTFGAGGNANQWTDLTYCASGGGGGGYYGGGGGGYRNGVFQYYMGTSGGGGGSGYVNTSVLTSASTAQQTASTTTNPDTSHYAGYIRVTVRELVKSLTVPVKAGGSWHDGTPYIKVNGIWQEASSVYIKQSNTWSEV